MHIWRIKILFHQGYTGIVPVYIISDIFELNISHNISFNISDNHFGCSILPYVTTGRYSVVPIYWKKSREGSVVHRV